MFRIKEAAAQHGLSLRQLARQSGVSESRVRMLANNRQARGVNLETLQKLAAVLHIRVSELLVEDDPLEVAV